MNKITREPLLVLTLGAVTLLLLMFIIYPIISVIRYPQLGDFLGFFARPRWIRATCNTLIMAGLSTAS
ncbi:MAG TPA: hypothetical protein GX506_00795, partial [Firmicutes bacterium]|nr:hypothetical protein [Bacillota bacterium]